MLLVQQLKEPDMDCVLLVAVSTSRYGFIWTLLWVEVEFFSFDYEAKWLLSMLTFSFVHATVCGLRWRKTQ